MEGTIAAVAVQSPRAMAAALQMRKDEEAELEGAGLTVVVVTTALETVLVRGTVKVVAEVTVMTFWSTVMVVGWGQ